MVGKVTPNTKLSASKVPGLLGQSKYETPNQILAGCINALQEIEPIFDANEAMHWGNLLEVPILLEASGRLGLSNLRLDHPIAYHHPDAPIACSLDGNGDGNGLIVHNSPEQGIYVIGQDSITLDGIGVLEAKLTANYPEESPAMSRGPSNSKRRWILSVPNGEPSACFTKAPRYASFYLRLTKIPRHSSEALHATLRPS